LEVQTLARSYESQSDNELVELARSGEEAAFAELWRRHADSGLRYAGSITRAVDSEDIVAEAFAKIFSLIKRGKGPTNGFRSYLATTIRHTSETFGRARRETPIDFADDLADARTDDEHQQRTLDQSLTITAFKSLSERWQLALWYSEVEQLSVKEAAVLLGIKPSAMAMLTFRAREGLREAWIQAHIAEIPQGSEHRWTIERLGAYARHGLPRMQQEMVEAHLRECESCSIVAEEARYVGSQLALALLVPIIGLGAATSYILSAGSGAGTAEITSGGATAHTPRRLSLRRPSSRTARVLVGATAMAAAAAAVSVVLVVQAHTVVSDTSAGKSDAGASSSKVAASSPSATSSPAPTSSGALKVTADTGTLHLFYPILSGDATPGAVVRILNGSTVLAKLTVPSDGTWSTSQLELGKGSRVTVTSKLDSAVEQDDIDVTIHEPVVRSSHAAAGVTVTITGAANAPFVLLAGGQAVAASRLNGTGDWSATYPDGALDLSRMVVRYQAGDRFGPAVPRNSSRN
jgi:RNA polymerase sigma factor (sigma-70 family)